MRSFLRELSGLGKALAFWVQAEEDLLFLLAEGKGVVAELRQGPELGEALRAPEELRPLLERAKALPPEHAVRALANFFGLHPDHALLGFLDLLEAEEEGVCPRRWSTLSEALLVKVGGSLRGAEALLEELAAYPGPLVLVHGGGPEIGEWLKRLGYESRFVGG